MNLPGHTLKWLGFPGVFCLVRRLLCKWYMRTFVITISLGVLLSAPAALAKDCEFDVAMAHQEYQIQMGLDDESIAKMGTQLLAAKAEHTNLKTLKNAPKEEKEKNENEIQNLKLSINGTRRAREQTVQRDKELDGCHGPSINGSPKEVAWDSDKASEKTDLPAGSATYTTENKFFSSRKAESGERSGRN